MTGYISGIWLQDSTFVAQESLVQPVLDEVAQDIGIQSLPVVYKPWLATVGVYRLYLLTSQEQVTQLWFGLPFNIFTRGEWKAILYHEMAHVVLKHEVSTHGNEYAADRFATECGYGKELISSLLKLDKMFGNTEFVDNTSSIPPSHPSTINRINRIESVIYDL